MSTAGLSAGAAGRAIAIEPGLPGAGLRLWSESFLGAETPLEARVLVLTSRGRTAVIVGTDVLWYSDEHATRIRATVAEAAGTKPDHVLLNASHAHSTPPTPGQPITDPTVDLAAVARFGDACADAIVSATRDAVGDLRPARLGCDSGTTPIGVYRREVDADGRDHLGEVPDRAIDRAVPVVRVDDLEGRPIAVVFSYGCHPVLHGPLARATSSDYPGAARALVDRELGTVGLFLQAGGGDVNPRYGIGAEADSRETKDREGMVLGAEVLRVAAGIRTDAVRGPRSVLHGLEISGWPWVPVTDHDAPVIAVAERAVEVPLSPLPPLGSAQQIAALHHAKLTAMEAHGAATLDLHVARRWARWSEVLVDAVRAGRDTIVVPAQVLRLGDLAIVAVAMELFNDTVVELRARSPLRSTLAIGYSNGFHGYLPRAEDLPRGGWSPLEHYAVPDLYPQAWLQPTAIGPAAERIMVDACLELLAQVAAEP